jgi:hypothetical protein
LCSERKLQVVPRSNLNVSDDNAKSGAATQVIENPKHLLLLFDVYCYKFALTRPPPNVDDTHYEISDTAAIFPVYISGSFFSLRAKIL